ncbi:MAG: hypothetical protein H7Y20_09095, partial [Bryobacteraceae bacterium]|nr:hypothetical protein [Bryobacteraceae bacterium]
MILTTKRDDRPGGPFSRLICVSAMLLLGTLNADAILIGSVNLGTAGPDFYTLLTIDADTKLTINNQSDVIGNVGVLGGAGKLSMSGYGNIDGTLFLSGPQTFDSTRADVIVANANAQLNQARMDAFAASAQAALQPATFAITTLESTQTIVGGPGQNVLDLTKIDLVGNDIVTLSAPAGGSFI